MEKQKVLLTDGHNYGTLAAARELGRLGLHVVLANPILRTLTSKTFTSKSRYVAENITCPQFQDIAEFSKWLKTFILKTPGVYIHPSNDHMVWAISLLPPDIQSQCLLTCPNLSAGFSLLNKEALHQLAVKVGFEPPKTLYPKSEKDLKTMAQELGFPLLLKPKTHMGYLRHTQGQVCYSIEQLESAWHKLFKQDSYHAEIRSKQPELCIPMLQEFLQFAAHDNLSISGYFDEKSGEIVGLATKQVFQQPRRLGVGIAYEAVPIGIADLKIDLKKIARLCTMAGYSGIFEVEFFRANEPEKYLLTDFNPRYYGKIGFDIARGINLPVLAYFRALGKEEDFQKLLADAKRADPTKRCHYVNRWSFELMIKTQKLFGHLTNREFEDWKTWLHTKEIPCFEAIIAEDDPLPHRQNIFQNMKSFLLNPPSLYHRFIKY